MVLVGRISKFDILCISFQSAECVVLAFSPFVPALLPIAVVEEQSAISSFSLCAGWQRELQLVLEVLLVWRAKKVKSSWK